MGNRGQVTACIENRISLVTGGQNVPLFWRMKESEMSSERNDLTKDLELASGHAQGLQTAWLDGDVSGIKYHVNWLNGITRRVERMIAADLWDDVKAESRATSRDK